MSYVVNLLASVAEVSEDEWIDKVGESVANNVAITNPDALEPLPGQVMPPLQSALCAVHLMTVDGMFGTPDKMIRVSITGHANPKREPTEGFTKDFVTISVGQA